MAEHTVPPSEKPEAGRRPDREAEKDWRADLDVRSGRRAGGCAAAICIVTAAAAFGLPRFLVG